MEATNVIIKPLLSEKTNRLAHSRNTYSFQVAPGATKPEIKLAIEKIYSVKVVDVRTHIRKGKARRTKTGYIYKTDLKRALVTLDVDSKIEVI